MRQPYSATNFTDFYNRLDLVDKIPRVFDDMPAGEVRGLQERWGRKVRDYYNGILNVNVRVEENREVSDFGIQNGRLLVNPTLTGIVRNEDFVLMHECGHEKQRLLLGFNSTKEMIESLTEDLGTAEIGIRDWVERYTMPPFVMSDYDRGVVFAYYNTQELRKNVAVGIRDIHSDVIALRNRSNIYVSDTDRAMGVKPDEKFFTQFKDELRANASELNVYDPNSVRQWVMDGGDAYVRTLVRKSARFAAVAGGSERVLGDSEYRRIADKYDEAMREVFGGGSAEYRAFVSLREGYQTYFVNCTQRTDLVDHEQMVTALDSPNASLRARAADFLGEIGDVRVLEPLARRLAKEEEGFVRWNIEHAIHDIVKHNLDRDDCWTAVRSLIDASNIDLNKNILKEISTFTLSGGRKLSGIPAKAIEIAENFAKDLHGLLLRQVADVSLADMALCDHRTAILGLEVAITERLSGTRIVSMTIAVVDCVKAAVQVNPEMAKRGLSILTCLMDGYDSVSTSFIADGLGSIAEVRLDLLDDILNFLKQKATKCPFIYTGSEVIEAIGAIGKRGGPFAQKAATILTELKSESSVMDDSARRDALLKALCAVVDVTPSISLHVLNSIEDLIRRYPSRIIRISGYPVEPHSMIDPREIREVHHFIKVCGEAIGCMANADLTARQQAIRLLDRLCLDKKTNPYIPIIVGGLVKHCPALVEDMLSLLEKGSTDRNISIRCEVASALGKMIDANAEFSDRVFPVLDRLSRDRSCDVRADTLSPLCKIAMSAPKLAAHSIRNILRLSRDKSDRVREFAADSIENILSECPEVFKELSEVLNRLSKDKDEFVRRHAFASMAKFGIHHPEHSNTVLDSLLGATSDKKTRFNAILGIDDLFKKNPHPLAHRSLEALNVVDGFKYDPEWEVQMEVAYATGKIVRANPDTADKAKDILADMTRKVIKRSGDENNCVAWGIAESVFDIIRIRPEFISWGFEKMSEILLSLNLLGTHHWDWYEDRWDENIRKLLNSADIREPITKKLSLMVNNQSLPENLRTNIRGHLTKP
jgi:3-methyladenine DNA glycosylase AlkC